MKPALLSTLLLFSVLAFAQKNNWRLSFQLQPEQTSYKNQYAFRWEEKFTKRSMNLGFTTTIQHNLTKRVFLEGGLAFISRKLFTTAFLDQSLLPPPYYDSTKILYSTKSIALRTLQIPLSIGIAILHTERTRAFIKGSFAGNYLLNATYEVRDYPAFKKNYWQGYSLNAGVGVDHQLNKKLALTGSLAWSLENTVAKDPYLFSQDDRPISLPHKYLQLSTGIRIDLDQP